MTTLATMLTLVRDNIDETSEIHWTDDQLTRWINQGLQDLARNTMYHQVSADIAYAGGDEDAAGPADAIRVHQAEWWPDDDQSRAYPLQIVEPRVIDQFRGPNVIASVSDPHYITAWGLPPSMRLKLYPVPLTSGTIRLTYYAYPDAVSSGTDDLTLPAGWDDAIVHYCEYRAMRQDRNPAWQEAKALYEASLEQLNSLTNSWSDNTGTILMTGAPPNWFD